MSNLSDLTMSNPNARVVGMVARTSGKRSSLRGDPADNSSTGASMIARASGNKIIRHGYPLGNADSNRSSCHGNPVDSAITAGAGKTKTVHFSKNQYLYILFSWPKFQIFHGGRKQVLVC